MGKIEDIRTGFEKAYIDGNVVSNLDFTPTFVSNNPDKGKKVLSTIEDELLKCDQFQISVAFITQSGIEPLLQTLKELEARNIHGEILTTNYLDFSEPKALKKLNEFNNIHLKMYDVSNDKNGLHTKGYIFKDSEVYRIIIGSSNMTKLALTTNREWNTKIISTENGQVAKAIVDEFNSLWNSKKSLEFNDFYEIYLARYNAIKRQREIIRKQEIPSFEDYELKPNVMQEQFIVNLKRLLEKGENRALLISATGTGKTFASAFAMRDLGFKKVLFLVHRSQLARQTQSAYERIFANTVTMGLVGDGKYEIEADYIFATVQTLAKDEHLLELDKNHFDAIILDEAHHSTAATYQKVIEHFSPRLFLGMTATPDKRDDIYDGKNVYEVFDHNIAQEIRLQNAMQLDLLCPFHYFGINDDFSLDDRTLAARSLSPEDFNRLTCDERIRHIVEQASYFGYSGEKVKGLIFCSRIEECKQLSAKFNNTINPDTGKCFRTVVLEGKSTPEMKEDCFEKLASDGEDYLDYIFSVDVLNEGVDIVEVNQIIMLRPTQSPIVFIQQLGRGLRKTEDKEFVVILDFIGNYNNNFMIPIALSGDRSYNKDNIRRYVAEGNRIIPGGSTIHFDEISRTRIYQSIDNASTNNIKLLKNEYESLRNRLGRVPTVLDFKENDSIEIKKFFEKCGSYYNFLEKYYPDDLPGKLNSIESEIIEFISKKLTNTKRIQDIAILSELLSKQFNILPYFNEFTNEIANYNFAFNISESVFRNLTNEFAKDDERKKYSHCVLIKRGSNGFELDEHFSNLLVSNPLFRKMVDELIVYGMDYYKENFSDTYKDFNLQLYQKYTYEDVCRLLNWQRNMNAQNIGGYFYDSMTKTLPVFINYDKTEDAIAYEDRFINNDRLIALSKHPRNVNSPDADHFYKRTESDKDNRILLFVRKNKDDNEAKEFYFLGEMYAEGDPKQIIMEKTKDNAFEINYRLDVPVREDIYEYIVKEG
ncbi:MAG: DEAD/DEAH box helicase [Pseudobutyrivibrio sp.]|nr:DEAD/DEAH box helicase [Pseudobutyrivibrio sp.]